jgi:translation initiation factor 1 (eIF-1/SUI1)
MDNFGEEFYKPETELENKYSNEIHLHRVSRGTRKCDVIVQGLVFNDNEQSKEFIKSVKKIGVSGTHKMMDDYDTINKVYVFSGDKRDEIAEILVNKFNRDMEFIKYHG